MDTEYNETIEAVFFICGMELLSFMHARAINNLFATPIISWSKLFRFDISNNMRFKIYMNYAYQNITLMITKHNKLQSYCYAANRNLHNNPGVFVKIYKLQDNTSMNCILRTKSNTVYHGSKNIFHKYQYKSDIRSILKMNIKKFDLNKHLQSKIVLHIYMQSVFKNTEHLIRKIRLEKLLNIFHAPLNPYILTVLNNVKQYDQERLNDIKNKNITNITNIDDDLKYLEFIDVREYYKTIATFMNERDHSRESKEIKLKNNEQYCRIYSVNGELKRIQFAYGDHYFFNESLVNKTQAKRVIDDDKRNINRIQITFYKENIKLTEKNSKRKDVKENSFKRKRIKATKNWESKRYWIFYCNHRLFGNCFNLNYFVNNDIDGSDTKYDWISNGYKLRYYLCNKFCEIFYHCPRIKKLWKEIKYVFMPNILGIQQYYLIINDNAPFGLITIYGWTYNNYIIMFQTIYLYNKDQFLVKRNFDNSLPYHLEDNFLRKVDSK